MGKKILMASLVCNLEICKAIRVQRSLDILGHEKGLIYGLVSQANSANPFKIYLVSTVRYLVRFLKL